MQSTYSSVLAKLLFLLLNTSMCQTIIASTLHSFSTECLTKLPLSKSLQITFEFINISVRYETGWSGRDSSVGISTRYGLDGPRIESRWGRGRDFPHPSRPALRPTPASYTVGTGSFLVVKRPGRSLDHPPTSKHRG